MESPVRRREAAQAYKRIARELGRLQTAAAEHISRRDNNQIFEIEHWLMDVAERIAKGYPETDYRRLLP